MKRSRHEMTRDAHIYLSRGEFHNYIINKSIEREVWLPIKEFDNYYSVSNLGRIKSNDRIIEYGDVSYSVRGKILIQTESLKDGHLFVILIKNGKRKGRRVHRLVALAFIEKEPGDTIIRHIDGNKKNNKSSNLEWCTQSENILK